QWRREAPVDLSRVIGRITAPVTSRLDAYLLAAAARLRNEPDNDFEGLDQPLLEHWVSHLQQAAAAADDPLHEWRRYATGDLKDLRELLQACEARTRALETDGDVMAAFPDDADLLTDGGLFLRASPEESSAACAVVLSDDPARPIAGLGGRVIVTPQLTTHSAPD